MFSQQFFLNKTFLSLMIKLVVFLDDHSVVILWCKVDTRMQLVQFRVVDLYMYGIIPI